MEEAREVKAEEKMREDELLLEVAEGSIAAKLFEREREGDQVTRAMVEALRMAFADVVGKSTTASRSFIIASEFVDLVVAATKAKAVDLSDVIRFAHDAVEACSARPGKRLTHLRASCIKEDIVDLWKELAE
jgi:hypothetical protein